MITYNWNITRLDTEGTNNTVTQIHWEIYATEGNITSPTIPKSTRLPGPSAETFIAYNDISEETAKTWLFSAMSSQERSWWEENCRINIEKIKNTQSPLGLPWD